MLGKIGQFLGAAAVSGVGLAAALSPGATAGTDDPHWATGTVNADGGLTAHIAPSVHAQDTHTFTDGARVSLDCVTKGTSIEGNTKWFLVSAEGEAKWVSARYVDVRGDQPPYCGAEPSRSVTLAEDTTSYQGPTTSDEIRRALHAGAGQEAVCYVNTGPGASERWVATLEAGWVPAATLTSIDHIPYCDRQFA